jgi:hypothetical protein
MPTTRAPFLRRVHAAALLGAAALTCAAAAQDVNPAPEPDRGLQGISPVWGYAIMAILGAAILGTSLLPARRGAQD